MMQLSIPNAGVLSSPGAPQHKQATFAFSNNGNHTIPSGYTVPYGSGSPFLPAQGSDFHSTITPTPAQHLMPSTIQSDLSGKRSRGEVGDPSSGNNRTFFQEHTAHPLRSIQSEGMFKKTRSNHYVRPKQSPKTFLATMGTLVPPPFPTGAQNSRFASDTSVGRVQLRRQLSGSRIEGFLGCDQSDAMDTEPSNCARIRSMSF